MQELEIPFWKQAPFIRALIPFIIGIVLSDQFHVGKIAAVALLLFPVIFLMSFRWLPLHFQFKWQNFQGILLHLLFMAWGIGLVAWQNQRTMNQWYGHNTNTIAWKLQLLTPPEEKNKTMQVTAAVIGVWQQNKEVTTIGKIKLLLEKDNSSKQLSYGDIVLIGVKPTPVRHSENPGAFNYQRYLQMQQIYEQVYVPASKWQQIYRHDGTGFIQRISRWQKQIRNILQQYLGDDVQVLGIAEALLIGYKADLDADLVQYYSSTGVVHIIAISGLHLGLIYWVLLRFLGLFPIFQKKQWLKAAIILSALWTFSLLTGASASVLRSAVMFTIIVIGEAGNRKSSIIQSLAASAFLLLIYNPYLLWDVGFQLSYLAIIGIISLQKPIEQLYFFKYKVIQYVWQMCSITLAAQVMTTPIALFYFHQFPNYFLAANLPAVPLSTIILFAELALLLLSPWPILAHPVAWLVARLIKCLNGIIVQIHHWPMAITDYLPASRITTCLLYALIVCLLVSKNYRNRRLLFAAAACFSLFVFSHLLGLYQSVRQQTMAVLQVRKSTALLVVNGRRCDFWGDTALIADPTSFNRYIRPALIEWRLTTSSIYIQKRPSSPGWFQFANGKMLLVNSFFRPEQWMDPSFPDWILLSADAHLSISDLPVEPKKTLLIFDSSIPLWKIAEWKKQCDALHLRCISIQERGAWIVKK